MSKHSDWMWTEYQQILAVTPVYENLNLDKDKHANEVLIHCSCHTGFITWVNGNQPIPVRDDLQQIRKMVCKNCQRPIDESAVSISGHSGGVFNVVMMAKVGGIFGEEVAK